MSDGGGEDEAGLRQRIAELEGLVANLEAEREETNQQAATRRAERMTTRAADADDIDDSPADPRGGAAEPTTQETEGVGGVSGPLSGVRVVECTHFIAGPLSGRLLADQVIITPPPAAQTRPTLNPLTRCSRRRGRGRR